MNEYKWTINIFMEDINCSLYDLIEKQRNEEKIGFGYKFIKDLLTECVTLCASL
jgi:hypothetical protein